MNTQKRLLIAFGAMALLVLVTALLGLRTASRANAVFDSYIGGTTQRMALANHVLEATNARAIAARNLVLATDPARMVAEKEAVAKAHADVQTYLAKLQERAKEATDPKVRALIESIAAVEAKYGPVALDIVAKASSGDREAAVSKMNAECQPLLTALLEAGDEYLQYGLQRGNDEVVRAGSEYAMARLVLLVTLVVAVAGAAALGVMITRGLMRSLGAEPDALGRAAQRISDGDLGPITGAEHALPGSVLASMMAMRGNLASLVSQVRGGSEGVAAASVEIAQGNQNLSGRTEQQANALQQTAASMEQLGSTVRQNADNARQANQLAHAAAEVATQGGTVVGEVVSTMQGISESSRKIGDIIGVIDGIAFQTNILALNAAVEAARAGEQGRGFAVVAGEVRSLAQRSAEAAKEIKGLITRNVEQVEQGTALVNQAGSTMDKIVGSVRRVSDIVGEISSASAEQSSGIEQVGHAVGQMDRVTQQNAALVQASAVAAESLKNQARQLVEAVSVFKL